MTDRLKRYQKMAAVFAALCMLAEPLGGLTVKAGSMTEITAGSEKELGTSEGAESETESAMEPAAGMETPEELQSETESAVEPAAGTEAPEEPESETESGVEPAAGMEAPEEPESETESAVEPVAGTKVPEELQSETESAVEPMAGMEAPAFQAKVEWSSQGWIVKGFFQDIPSDTILVQPMCSTDGEAYRDCGQAWNLQWLSSEDDGAQEKLRNQRCLYDSEEPFKSYLSKELDRFFIKLRIVREGGIAIETQAAVIERERQQPVPGETEMSAWFSSSMRVREGRPPQIQYYGRYQITVREDVTVEEISAVLPDTLPVEVQIQRGNDYIGNDIVECPVRWKPLNLPQLTAGESVTFTDAAEEIVVPAGTVLHTQTGTYQVEEPVGMNRPGTTDEVRLVLNAVAGDGQPEGALSEENYGLDMVFSLKPTGASAIRAYFLREGDTAWTEIADLALTGMINKQPSTAGSGYALVLGKDQEPYRTYRKAKEAGEKPEPFLVGVKIEGGVFDGRQLVLAWPETYELPVRLPEMGGSGGNEGNAGSDDRDDSTEDGQRPGLSDRPSEPPAGGTAQPSSSEPSGQSGAGENKISTEELSGETQVRLDRQLSGVPSASSGEREDKPSSRELPGFIQEAERAAEAFAAQAEAALKGEPEHKENNDKDNDNVGNQVSDYNFYVAEEKEHRNTGIGIPVWAALIAAFAACVGTIFIRRPESGMKKT